MPYTKQNARVSQFNASAVFDANDAVLAVNCKAYLENRLVDGADTVMRGIPVVSFDLLNATLSSTNITAAGKTITYPQLAALLRQAALDRANAAGVS